MDRDHSSEGIESQGHRSRSGVRLELGLGLTRVVTRSVWPRSWIEGSLYFSCYFASVIHVEARSIAIGMSGCQSVCRSVRSRISRTTCPNFVKVSVHVACDRE